jgi:alginate O-acetyltransferase complex protein AlgI
MVFSSAAFLYFFLPVFLILYYASPAAWRNWTILIASLTFYTAGAGTIVFVLLVSVWLNQFVAVRLTGRNSALWLTLGIFANVAALIYYKYTPLLWSAADYLLVTFAGKSLGSAPEIALPIGISFFTFQALSYLIDVWRHVTVPAESQGRFSVYHTLFPQLVAGPIVRYSEIGDELRRRHISLDDATAGALRFCFGFAKKIVLADNLGAVTDQILQLPANELTAGHAWLAISCYTLQIFYDFSGYSDMAIGLGRMLGFHFPENFDQPYRATSVTDFWRRWHMTLTRWFRDYVYIPLGGNRAGTLRTYLNLTVVFVLCGLWHGAAWGFLIWGLYHGALLVLERVAHNRFDLRPRGLVGFAITLVLVMIGWVFFRITDLPAALHFLRTMFGFGTADTFYFPVRYFLAPDVAVYLAIGVALALGNSARWKLSVRTPVFAGQLIVGLALFFFAALQLAANTFNPFIYFRF